MADPKTRPNVPTVHTDPVEHRRQIAERVNAALSRDGSTPMQEPLPLSSVTVAELPAAAAWEGSLVYVPDESGGSVLAFSDGADWRRVTDRAVVS